MIVHLRDAVVPCCVIACMCVCVYVCTIHTHVMCHHVDVYVCLVCYLSCHIMSCHVMSYDVMSHCMPYACDAYTPLVCHAMSHVSCRRFFYVKCLVISVTLTHTHPSSSSLCCGYALCIIITRTVRRCDVMSLVVRVVVMCV